MSDRKTHAIRTVMFGITVILLTTIIAMIFELGQKNQLSKDRVCVEMITAMSSANDKSIDVYLKLNPGCKDLYTVNVP